MKFLILFLLLTVSVAAQTFDQCYSHFVRWEGFRHDVYRDKRGWAVGIGHKVPHAGPEYRNVPRAQIIIWFENDIRWVRLAAYRQVPNFFSHPEQVRLVIMGVIFTTGERGFYRFTRFRKALLRRDYLDAAWELDHSKWYDDVGPTRANAYIKILKDAAR